MRELKFGEQTVRVRATPLALIYFKQEFNEDLAGGLVKMSESAKDPSKIDSVFLLRLIWAMAKADGFGKEFPSFLKWVESLEYFDLSDQELLISVVEEAGNGFFRKGVKGATSGK